MSATNVELVEVAQEQKEILANLMQFYLYEATEFSDDDITSSGKLSLGKYFDAYWRESERHPFFIKDKCKLVGFALVRQIGEEKHSISEFFVMRKHRRSGIGKKVAFLLFQKFQAEWHVAQEQTNVTAQLFWKSIIREYTNDNFQETYNLDQPKRPKQVFHSRVLQANDAKRR